MKKILVDMSATLIHHGHIRLLRKAKELGIVIVALTTDDEILKKKGYVPELPYDSRKEILEAIKYVDKVVPSKWKIEESFLDELGIDLLVHGSDNSNDIKEGRLIVFERTKGISSSILRGRVLKVIGQIYDGKE